jgi:hypothetical protein
MLVDVKTMDGVGGFVRGKGQILAGQTVSKLIGLSTYSGICYFIRHCTAIYSGIISIFEF